MTKVCSSSMKTIYSCEIWVCSTDIKVLNQVSKLLPGHFRFRRLAVSTKRFTLLRSPLGNKKHKDQYKHCEYGINIFSQGINAGNILYFLDLLYLMVGCKAKVLVSSQKTI